MRRAAVLGLLLLAACSGSLAPEPPPAGRTAYQQRIVPLYPSAETPRITRWGDFDTPRAYRGESWRHAGLDIVGRAGDPVIAVAPGEACTSRNDIDGLVIHLRPRLAGTEGSRELLFYGPRRAADGSVAPGSHRLRIGYAHLSGAAIPTGQCRAVALGERLGFIGSSGMASQPHLHFEIVVEEPAALPGEPGLKGAINPLLLMRREAGQPLGGITCYQPGMTYRTNGGDASDALAIVWPTEDC
jgi:murein DD-endopeptidase MepM/ murein hydrolase activator NlpD